MPDKKPLTSYLLIAFGISWALFLAPLAFQSAHQNMPALVLVFFSLAMWGPGLAALITTKWVEKTDLSSLRLKHLGDKRTYLWAWLLPILVSALTLLTTLLFGTGQLDLTFGFLREAVAKSAGTQTVPPVGVMVAQQMLMAFSLAPFINTLFALGEELGWRGFLLPHLLPLGRWQAILLTGAIWGFWHAPTTLFFGYNFPAHPYLGILLMIIGCMLLGTLLAWLYLRTGSPWAPAFAHGTINAVAGVPLLFLKPGVDNAFGGSLLGLAGWIPMMLVIAWLLWRGQPFGPAVEDKM